MSGRVLAVVAALMFFHIPAQSQWQVIAEALTTIDALASSGGYMSGQQLYEQGKIPQFSGYIIGIHDADQGAEPRSLGSYCVPDAVRSPQLVDIAYKYLQDHPANRHESAAFLVRQSFRELWPCTRKKP
jgi:hypothetical protein